MKDLIISQKASGNTFVVSDLHGISLETFQSFVETNIGENDELVICGDIIDRGPDSIELLLYIMDHKDKIKIILGNHEVSFLCAYALKFLDENNEQDKQIKQDMQNFLFPYSLEDFLTTENEHNLDYLVQKNSRELIENFGKANIQSEDLSSKLREIFDFLNTQPLCRRIRPERVTKDHPEQDLYFIHANLPKNYCCEQLDLGEEKVFDKSRDMLLMRYNAIWPRKEYVRHPGKTIYCGHDVHRPLQQKLDNNCTYYGLDFASYATHTVVAHKVGSNELYVVGDKINDLFDTVFGIKTFQTEQYTQIQNLIKTCETITQSIDNLFKSGVKNNLLIQPLQQKTETQSTKLEDLSKQRDKYCKIFYSVYKDVIVIKQNNTSQLRFDIDKLQYIAELYNNSAPTIDDEEISNLYCLYDIVPTYISKFNNTIQDLQRRLETITNAIAQIKDLQNICQAITSSVDCLLEGCDTTSLFYNALNAIKNKTSNIQNTLSQPLEQSIISSNAGNSTPEQVDNDNSSSNKTLSTVEEEQNLESPLLVDDNVAKQTPINNPQPCVAEDQDSEAIFNRNIQNIKNDLEGITKQVRDYTDFSFYAFCFLGVTIGVLGALIPICFKSYRDYFFSSSLEYGMSNVLNKIDQIVKPK